MFIAAAKVQCSEIGNGILTKYHYLAVDYERRLAEPETTRSRSGKTSLDAGSSHSWIV
jgi:hypothetical protein